MIRAVLIDDERPALRELEFMLSRYPDIAVIGAYKDPEQAMETMGELNPDVVFLDINMPKLKGTDAASRILDASPGSDIVFVTAYDFYAVEAFELHALDYILKPIQTERFEKTIRRIMEKKSQARPPVGRKLKIQCLGRFSVGWEGCEPIKWRTEKTKELFAYLLANAGRGISKDKLIDTLWGEEEPDKAIKQLYNGVYYIRKALESYGIDRELINIDNSYNLRLGPVEVDVNRFCTLSRDMDSKSLGSLQEMEALYEGDYLEGDYYLWAEEERERLLRLYIQCICRLSVRYLEEREFEKAEELLLKAFRRNSYDQNITLLLLKLYKETGNRLNALRHYNTYSQLIEQELGITPDETLRALIHF